MIDDNDYYALAEYKMPIGVKQLIDKAWSIYYECRRYSNDMQHEVNQLAANLLDGIENLKKIWNVDDCQWPKAVYIRKQIEEDLSAQVDSGLKLLEARHE